MLDVDALDRTDALRERERLGPAERLGGVPVTIGPDDRRVEALLDRGPDAEDRREGEARDLEVAAVADVDFVDLVEVVLGGVRGEDVGEPGVHAHADQGQLAAALPLAGHGELLVAELLAGHLEGPIRMRVREAHGHVHVVRIGGEGAVEDRHHELRVDGVHDEVRAVGAGRIGHARRRRGRRSGWPGIDQRRRGCRPASRARLDVVVGEDHGLAPVGRSRRCGRSPRPRFRHRSAGLACFLVTHDERVPNEGTRLRNRSRVPGM